MSLISYALHSKAIYSPFLKKSWVSSFILSVSLKQNHIAQFELSFEVYTCSFSEVLLVAFYYQEMASAKDKVTETTDTTAETEVKEVGGKVDKCYGDRLYGQFFEVAGIQREVSRKSWEQNKKRNVPEQKW